MSHTVTVKIECRDQEALARACLSLGGTVLGAGTHKLYSSEEAGFAVQLPNWRYPIIAKQDGSLTMDHYGGRWGRVEDVDRLRERYVVEAARTAAEAQGWYVEDRPDGGLTVYHPGGGTLQVEPSGSVDACGFIGAGCAAATSTIASAMGESSGEVRKSEYYRAERAHVRAREEEL